MRKLSVNTFVTLDGIMQAPGGPEEDPSGGFALGGWSVNYWDDEMGLVMDDYMGKPFDLVLGRKTYEIFAGYWPNVPDDAPHAATAKVLNQATKNVASRTLKTVYWERSVLIEGDVVVGVAALKEQDGPELQIHGSGNLIQSLLPTNLIDEFRVWTFPLVVGSGKRLFADGTVPSGLKLADHKVFATGVVFATYVPAGPVESGSFGPDEPSETELERRKKLES